MSCDTLIFLDKDPAYKTWAFTLVCRSFYDLPHSTPYTQFREQFVQNSVYPDCIKGFPNVKKAAENLATALKHVINCFRTVNDASVTEGKKHSLVGAISFCGEYPGPRFEDKFRSANQVDGISKAGGDKMAAS